MHSTTITAILLPLLLSSVLAVPTPVQKETATQSGPPSAPVSLENGLLKSGQPLAAAWVSAGSPGRKRTLKGRQETPPESPEALHPNAGETPEDLDIEQGMANAEYAQATGQDPAMCNGSCGRSLKGQQEDPEVATTPATNPS